MIIFCGHFPDGALHFTEEELEDETRAEWYLRQMLGSANFEGGRLLHVMSGQLGYQIEHHLFPDLPSQPLRADVGAGPRARREVRPPLHDRPAAPAVRPGAADDHEAVAAQPLHLLRPARAPGQHRAGRGGRPSQVDATPSARGRSAQTGDWSSRNSSVRLVVREDLRDGSTRLREPTRAWVTQCALSRICGLCEAGLGRPIAFVGTPRESDRNQFHQPPMHLACAERCARRTRWS